MFTRNGFSIHSARLATDLSSLWTCRPLAVERLHRARDELASRLARIQALLAPVQAQHAILEAEHSALTEWRLTEGHRQGLCGQHAKARRKLHGLVDEAAGLRRAAFGRGQARRQVSGKLAAEARRLGQDVEGSAVAAAREEWRVAQEKCEELERRVREMMAEAKKGSAGVKGSGKAGA